MNLSKIVIIVFICSLAELIYSTDTNSTKYFPLKVGNAWSYEYYSPAPPPAGTRYRFRSIVTKDTLIGSHRYYFVTNTHIYVLNNPAINWFRVDSSNGNLLAYQSGLSCRPGGLILIDSLASGINDMAQVCTSIIARRKCYQSGTDTLFTQQVPYKIFNYEIITAGDYKTYSKNFGITYCYTAESGAYTITLLGCVLDGVLYGDTTLIGLQPISEKIPGKFSLSQNYPNPFNPTTKIKFDLPKSNLTLSEAKGLFVKLIIYDVLGREIASLVNEQLQPGTYEVEWDGSNYPSGVYFFKLIVENASTPLSITKKMVLIK